MRSRVTGFILFLIFILVFYGSIRETGKIMISGIESNGINKSEFIETIDIMLSQIKSIQKRKDEFSKKSSSGRSVNIRVFYLMLSPQKEAGIYVNGREYLVKEGTTIGSNIKILQIEENGIIADVNEKKYYISK